MGILVLIPILFGFHVLGLLQEREWEQLVITAGTIGALVLPILVAISACGAAGG